MKKILLSLILFFPVLAQAQRSAVSAGGDATGKTGTASYSVGQLFYTPVTSESGSSSPGVQQSYEISELPALLTPHINLKMSVYPNPTSHFITLHTENFDNSNLTYTLFGMNGQTLRTGAIKELQTEVSMENLGATIYLLKVFSNSDLIKTFQIIKNN